MKKKTIEKTTAILAPKEKVWQVLLDDAYNRQWFTIFSEGTYAETDWRTGSKAIFKDKSNTGMLATVIQNKPNALLSLEYQGMVTADGREDYESEEAVNLKGGRETYTLSEQKGTTHLAISSDMAEAYYEPMSQAWDKAMLKIKDLAESM